MPVAVAVMVASVLRVPLLGAGPLFPVPPHVALLWPQLVLCLVVGVIAGLGSAGLTGMVYAAEDAFAKLPIHWMWWPMIGGLAIGIGGLVQPRALGVGYDTIRDLLTGSVGQTVVVLMLVKALMWSIALGSGTSGGVLAPLLIMGGALGATEAHLFHAHDIGLWAIVSMAAMMGGTMRSPLTAVAFLLELTHDVALLPGILVACVAAHAVTVLLMKRSILTEKVARRGYHVSREYSVSPFSRHRVEDVMDREVAALPAAWQVGGADALVVAYPDELLETALQRLARAGVERIPVVARDDSTTRVGMLGHEAFAAAYRLGLDDEDVREVGHTRVAIRRAMKSAASR